MDADGTLMGIDHGLYTVQTNTLIIDHGVEGMLLELVLDTNTIIGHLYLDVAILLAYHTDTNLTVFMGKEYRVVEQCQQSLRQQDTIIFGLQLFYGRDEVDLDRLAFVG